jgi:hypothetical protein
MSRLDAFVHLTSSFGDACRSSLRPPYQIRSERAPLAKADYSAGHWYEAVRVKTFSLRFVCVRSTFIRPPF